jgi:pyruvate/2-oxoglutarate dehydrogenase complex dihydrolipoamide acyltransferase (E2) component
LGFANISTPGGELATEIKMPQLGETVVEGTITKWLKQEGDTVEADEYIVEVSTDKVDSEVPSSASGVIQKILVPEGETVQVGTAIALVGEDGQAAEPEASEAEPEEEEQEQPAPAEEAEEEPAAEEQERPAEAGGGRTEEAREPAASDEDRQRMAEAEKEPSAEEQTPRAAPAPEARPAAGGDDTSKRGIISPLVRRLAEEHDVNLDEVEGSGTGGRIRKQDVMRYVEERKAKPAAKPAASAEPAPQPREAPAQAGGREELVSWTNIRRRTAEHMVASHLETARAWNAVEVDWTDVVAVRERLKGAFREREGFNLTYMAFLAKAICETLLQMPEVNASFDEVNQANRVKYYVNLGIAVALEGGGLIVPVVKGADEKNVVGLARAINDVATRARSKKLSPDDLTGGTFTITNPGPFGSVISVPIIPQGQAAIIGFETITKRVVVTDDDAIAIRSIGILDMSWDHRIIDGAEAARFLGALKEKIETTDFSAELTQYA